LLEASILRLRTGIACEISQEFGSEVGRFFIPNSYRVCNSPFSELVYSQKRIARSFKSLMDLAALVQSVIQSQPIIDLDELVMYDGVALLTDPRLHKNKRLLEEQRPVKRMKLSQGGAALKGKEICPKLWQQNPAACKALLQNGSFRVKFPLEWRALRSLQC
jgi:hypothetical protein